ncbi:MAG: hypothetical protein M4579_006329, partial [Chaenotheca gracillima]
AADQGLPPDTPNYCNCGGITVPLLSATGATTFNCDYSTQPTTNVALGTKSVPPKSSPSPSSSASTLPAGATVVTETVSNTPLVVTYIPTKAKSLVTSTTTDTNGHTGIIIIPIGGFIWGLFGKPPLGLPPLPAPPGGIGPPPDPDPKDPDPPKPNSEVDKGSMTTNAASTTSKATTTSSALSCNLEDVGLDSDYPFSLDSNGDEYVPMTFSADISDFTSATPPPVTTTAPPPPPPPSSPPPPPPPPYATGQCGVHVKEYAPSQDNFENAGKKFTVDVTIKDANGKTIGGTKPQADISGTLSLSSQLPDYLVMNHNGGPEGLAGQDFLTFNYGGDGWSSHDPKRCTQETFDDEKNYGASDVTKQMDCSFACG